METKRVVIKGSADDALRMANTLSISLFDVGQAADGSTVAHTYAPAATLNQWFTAPSENIPGEGFKAGCLLYWSVVQE